MKKSLIFIFIFFLVTCSHKSSQYYNEVLSNIIQNTASGAMSANGREEIIINELSQLSYQNALQALEDLSILEPKVLKGIKSNIRQKIDEKYKNSLLE